MFKKTAGNLSTGNETTALHGEFSEDVNDLLLILIVLLIIVTVLGNSIVILAFIVDKRLRNQSSFFLLNLSICDFITGAVIVPFYLPYRLSGKWMLGTFLCQVSQVIDYTVLTVSTFSIVLISYDRFLSVIKAVFYHSLQKKHSHTFVVMASAWILAILMYVPAIIVWENDPPANACVASFNNNWYFRLGMACLDFILPMISILFFNVAIYCNIKRRNRKKKQNSILQCYKEKDNDGRPSIIGTCVVLSSPQLQGMKDLEPSTKNKNINFFFKQCIKREISSSTEKQTGSQISIQRAKLSQDEKLAKSLSVIVFMFVLCCAPYSFLATVLSICRGYCVDFFWFDLTFWMLFVNSAINPFLYALCHKGFKCALILFLRKCKLFTKNNSTIN